MLDSFFQPQSVAVIGASRTPGKVGHDIVQNLLDAGFEGPVYPVNPKADEVLGLDCYSAVTDIEEDVELAVIVIPAPYVLSAIEQCAQKGIRAVIVITAGFKEAGEEGAELEKQLREKCKAEGIRCIGPNCLGVMSPPHKLDASFGATMPKPGNTAFLSQSGALGTAILDVAVGQGYGMSRFISIGNKADVNESDLIAALGEDEKSDVILGYLESIDNGRRFMDVARQVTQKKPVIIFKSGRTSAGAQAASSHTGSLAGADSAYDAAFQQCGVIRSYTATEFFDYSRGFAAGTLPSGNRIAVVTNAGGPGIIATDAIEESDLEVATLADETIRKLQENLPPQANTKNPVDVLGDAASDRYKMAIETVLADDGVDGIVCILTPQTSTECDETARVLADAAEATDKPVIGCFMGNASVTGSWQILDERGVPNFDHPDRCITVMEALYRHAQWRGSERHEPPRYVFDDEAIRRTIEDARERGTTKLQENHARDIAAACGIPLPQSILATDADEAVQAAEDIGYPVVMKISSEDILHKSDAGGVKVGLEDADQVRAAFEGILANARDYKEDASIDGVLVQETARKGTEIIIGVNRDPQFGPVVMFGLGGIYVELLKDVQFRVAPLTLDDARQMIRGIRSAQLLQGFRGEAPRDTDTIAEVLMRISQLANRYPEITECDLNPVMVYPREEGLMAVDVRFALAD
jgi:acetyltransferase